MKGVPVLGCVLLCAGGVASCLGQSGNVLIIRITNAKGHLIPDRSFVNIPFAGKPSVIEWVTEQRNPDFRIGFIDGNPCDPHTSHLDGLPAVCNILPDQSGTYAYQIRSRRNPQLKSPVVFARVGSCDACQPVTNEAVVGIGCRENNTGATPENATANRGRALTWTALEALNLNWTVTFDKDSQCRQKSFGVKNPVCAISGGHGEYPYTTTLEGCAKPGKGQVTVK